MNAKSQNAKILSYLKKGRRLTALQALEKFGCFRLASRIHDLKEHGIESKFITLQNGKRVKQYFISK